MKLIDKQLLDIQIARGLNKDACEHLYDKAIEVYQAAITVAPADRVGIAYSSSEAGESYYVTYAPIIELHKPHVCRVIRISDHDCGVFRMQEQLQIRDYSIVNPGDIEIFFYPEQFKPVYKEVGVKVGEGNAEAKSFVPGPGVTSVEPYTAKSGKAMVRYTYEKVIRQFAGYQKIC